MRSTAVYPGTFDPLTRGHEDIARRAASIFGRVEITGYSGLTVDFARAHDLAVIVRGLRAVSDFEFEFQLASMGRHLQPDVETVFMVPKEKFTFISSTLVREVATLGGDVSTFVHPLVQQAFKRRLAGKS